jgi:hypothetical protein
MYYHCNTALISCPDLILTNINFQLGMLRAQNVCAIIGRNLPHIISLIVSCTHLSVRHCLA